MSITDGDIARLVASCVYALISGVLAFLCMLLYRHKLSNRSKEYVERYKNYINALALLACGGFFIALGNVVVLIDQGESEIPQSGRESQWGWWIGFALFLTSVLLAIGKYHRLTNFEELTAVIMAASTGVTFVFLSLSGSSDGKILWTVLLFVSTVVTHLFLLWKSQRIYALYKSRKERGYTRYFGYIVADVALLLFSAGMITLVGITLVLGPEAYDVISTDIATETMYASFISIYFVVVSIMVLRMFIDINDQILAGMVFAPPLVSNKNAPTSFGKLPERFAKELDSGKLKTAKTIRSNGVIVPQARGYPQTMRDISYV